MFNTFRKHQRGLMLIVATLTIVAFAFFYDYNRHTPGGSGDVGKIYGHNVTQVEVERKARSFQLGLAIGVTDMLQTLAYPGRDQDEAIQEFIWNSEILKHEANEMGIEPTHDQILLEVRSLPAFQTAGEFDPVKYGNFIQTRLGPLGFTETQIADLATDSLRLARIRQVITSQVAVDPKEVDQALKIFQPVDIQVVKINLADAAKNITVPEEKITRFYEENKVRFVTNETRSVDFVKLDPPANFAGLKDKERMAALQKLTDNVTAFMEKEKTQGFDLAAKDAGYRIGMTPEFTQTGEVPADKGKATPAQYKDIAQDAFHLEKVGSVSDAIQSGDSFYVIVLKKITPSRSLTIEEIRPVIIESLKNESARKAIEITAQSSIEKIRQAMKAGKSFADAAKELGLTVSDITGVTPSQLPGVTELNVNQENQAYAASTMFLREGQISGFEKNSDGGYIVYLAKRAPADPTIIAQEKPKVEKFILQNKQMLIFMEWMRTARDSANIVTARRAR